MVDLPGVTPDHESRFVGSRLRVPERLVRMSIAALVPVFGSIALVMLFSGEGPTDTLGRSVLVAVAVSTVPAAVIVARANLIPILWARRLRPWGVNHLFVLYGDTGVTVALVTFSRPETALFGTLLFAILSAYVAYFCSPVVRNLHMVFTTAVIVAFSVLTWRTGDFTTTSVVARGLVAIAVVNGTLLLQSMFAFGVRTAIRDTLLHAHQDWLTSLWNRRGFMYWATATVKGSGRRCVGMLCVDIDDFKSINDTHGHRAGDDVLEVAADRLQAAVGSNGVLGRTGGDEFAIATELNPPELIRLAESIRVSLHRSDDAVPVTASVGVAYTSRAGSDPAVAADAVVATMLHAADSALYEAKAAGRNRVAVVDLTVADQRPKVVPAAGTGADSADNQV